MNILIVLSWNSISFQRIAVQIASLCSNDPNNKIYIHTYDPPFIYNKSLNYSLLQKIVLGTDSSLRKSLCAINCHNNIKVLHTKSTKISLPGYLSEQAQQLRTSHDIRCLHSKSGLNFGLGILSVLSDITRDPDVNPKLYLKLICNLIQNCLFIESILSKLFNDLPIIDLCFLPNGRFEDHQVYRQLLYRRKIPFNFFENSLLPSRYYLQPYTPHSYSHRHEEILSHVSNQANNRKIDYFYKSRSQGKVINDYRSYTTNFNQSYTHLHPQKPLVVFFSSTDYEYTSVSEENPYKHFGSQLNIIYLVSYLCKMYDYHFVLRMHPNQSTMNQSLYHSWLILGSYLTDSGFEFFNPSNSMDSYSILSMCDLVVTAGSTITMEAVNQNIPVLITAPSFVALPSISERCVFSPPEIINLFSNPSALFSTVLKKFSSDPYALWSLEGMNTSSNIIDETLYISSRRYKLYKSLKNISHLIRTFLS